MSGPLTVGEAALRGWAVHHDLCGYRLRGTGRQAEVVLPREWLGPDCTCGLHAALAALPVATAGPDLREYARHKPGCASYMPSDSNCSCGLAAALRGAAAQADPVLVCDWPANPDEVGHCPYCAGAMCARIDGGLNCTHNRRERHG